MNQDFPRVYRLRNGWRNTFVVLGAVFAVGGLVGTLFAREMSDHFAGQVVMAVICLGFALMGVYTVLDMLRTRVVLHAESIELQRPFSKRSLWRPDIEGRRFSTVLRFEPRRESLSRAMEMPEYLATDAVFDAWMASIPDLDAREADRSLDALLEDPALPGSTDEKLSELVRARKIAKNLSWAALAVACWLWFYPHPYDLAIACGISIPWIAVIVAVRGGPLYKFSPERNDAAASLLTPVTLPGFALVIRALFDTHVLEWQNMTLAIIATLAVCMLFLWLATDELRASKANTAAIAFLMVPYACGTATLVNMWLDHGEPQRYEAEVLGARISKGKTTSYYLKLGPWGPVREANEVDASRSYYDRASRQGKVCVYLYRGALGVRWFEVGDCPRR